MKGNTKPIVERGGGANVEIGGDFKESLPVVPRVTRGDELNYFMHKDTTHCSKVAQLYRTTDTCTLSMVPPLLFDTSVVPLCYFCLWSPFGAR